MCQHILFAPADLLTTSYVPVKPFPDPPELSPTLEVDEFVPPSGELSHPHSVYKNHLYVYPRSLKYDSQKIFAKVSGSHGCYPFTFIVYPSVASGT